MPRPLARLCAALLAALACVAAPCLPRAEASTRAVVLPLQPAPGTPCDGLGPAVQNLVENALLLNPGFEETFFLNHSEVFADAGELQAYILGLRAPSTPLPELARRGVRFVLGGVVGGEAPGEPAQARLWCEDLKQGGRRDILLPLDADTGLTRLRAALAPFLAGIAGRPYSPAQARALARPEPTSLAALAVFGRAYGAYLVLSRAGLKAALDLPLSGQACDMAPGSATALNMHGWVLHASGRNAPSADVFRKTLRLDPESVDALDGMARIALETAGQDQALPWALRKARTRNEDTGAALARLQHHLGLLARGDNRDRWAAWHFRKATILDPAWDRPLLDLTRALSGLDRFEDAQRALDDRLRREQDAALRGRFQEQKALVHLWAARHARQAKDEAGCLRSMEQALAALKEQSAPDQTLRWFVEFEFAQALMRARLYPRAAGLLEGASPPGLQQSLERSALLALCRARLGLAEEARTLARQTLAAMAEQERRRDPLPRSLYTAMGVLFQELDRQDLARVMERRATPDKPGAPGPRE